MSSSIKLRKFECPVCYDVIVPPVYQCRNGHLICQDCVKKCSTCPTCREPMSTVESGRIRCLELEKIIRECDQVYSCPHDGCQEKNLKADDYMEHKKNCVYRKAAFCSLLRVHDACNAELPLNKLEKHLKECSLYTKGGIVSADVVTFDVLFNQEFRGTFVFFGWVTGLSNENETFPIALVETSKDHMVYWSPMILASPTFTNRFVCDISVHPVLAAYDAPKIEFKLRMKVHCPECGAWNETQDFCTTMSNLKQIADASENECYEVKLRLYDKNEGRYYQFRCSDDAK